MINLVSLKCPECNAALAIEEGRKHCFCQYCGTKILIDDGSSTHTYRKIDEARIKEAEVRERIRLKELSLEEQKHLTKEKKRKSKIKYTIILGIIAAVGFVCCEASEMLASIGLAAFLGIVAIWQSEDKK